MSSTLRTEVLLKYSNPVFIETGTLNGDGVRVALSCGFKRIYSIDINPEIVSRNQTQFLDYGERVQIIHGDSFEVLQTLLPTMQEPITFWLDGHWDGGPEGQYRCPLLHELDVIAQHPIKTHTLLIDDRRLFGDASHQWGREVTEDAVREKILAINPQYQIIYEPGHVPNDIIAAIV